MLKHWIVSLCKSYDWLYKGAIHQSHYKEQSHNCTQKFDKIQLQSTSHVQVSAILVVWERAMHFVIMLVSHPTVPIRGSLCGRFEISLSLIEVWVFHQLCSDHEPTCKKDCYIHNLKGLLQNW